MAREIEKLFRAPYAMPNGLQVTDDGLWIVDQITDRVALIEMEETSEYGVPRIISEIASESSNTSGMAYGGESLWLTANGEGRRWRPARATDAKVGESDILRVNPKTVTLKSGILYPAGVARMALNTTTTKKVIYGLRPSKIESCTRCESPTGLCNTLFLCRMTGATVLCAWKMASGLCTLLTES